MRRWIIALLILTTVSCHDARPEPQNPGGSPVIGIWREAPPDLKLDQPVGSQVTTLKCGDAGIQIVAGPDLPVPLAMVHTWVVRAATALTAFYGHFPVTGASVLVLAEGDGAVHGGVTFNGRKITVHLGTATTDKDLKEDWILTHEMFHLAFPDLDEDYIWMEEGAACYFEPLARARVGQLDTARLWLELMQGAPQGQPEAGDQGLDKTHTWGRTYWGGTLFWLLADLDIRNRTNNKHCADDVLRGLIQGGSDGSSHWEMASLLATADRITGVDALTALHKRQGARADTIDLKRLWHRLGVSIVGDTVHFDDDAEWAGLRRAMTAPNVVPSQPAAR